MAKKDRDESNSSEDAPRQRRSAQFTADLKTEDAATYLEALAQALRDTRIVVQTGNETLDVRVAPRLALGLEARSSRGAKKSSIELRLNWSEPYELPTLYISSGSAPNDDDMETVVSAAPSQVDEAIEEATHEVAEAAEED